MGIFHPYVLNSCNVLQTGTIAAYQTMVNELNVTSSSSFNTKPFIHIGRISWENALLSCNMPQ
jgi:hypothetical protein